MKKSREPCRDSFSERRKKKYMKSFLSKFAEKRGVSCLPLWNQIPAGQLTCGRDASLFI